ncbi:hypothetical protein AB7M35_000968 [Amorphus suaedae]
MIKCLVAGLGAGFLLSTAAQAADLPVAPEPIDYVRVCDAFGAGFYYIPGTDTCISVRGRIRTEYRYFASEYADHARDYNSTSFRARGYIYMDSRTNTEFGLLRAYNEVRLTIDSPGSTSLSLEHAFVQFGGFTFGKTQSFYDFLEYTTFAFAWVPSVDDTKTAVAAYTYAFGNGVSSTLAIETSDVRRTGIGGYAPDYGGTKYPDLVANVRIDQGWGSAQVMGALHQVWPGYNALGATPDSELGWVAGAGATVNLPFGSGASINFQGSYSQGAVDYVSSQPQSPTGDVYDAYLNSAGDLDLSTAWSLSGGFAFDLTPSVAAHVMGGYLDFQNDAWADGDFKNYDLQGNLTWSPVAGLLLGVEVDYRYVDASSSLYEDGSVWAGDFRVQRTF